MATAIVCGGGIVGMTTARELAIRGFSVTLFDQGKLGQQASWAAGGILSSMRPWAENPESARLSEQGKNSYAHFAATLKAETGIDPEYHACGLLMIDPSEVKRTQEWATRNQIHHTTSITQLQQSDLSLPKHNIFLPEIAQIRVPRLLQALRISLNTLNITIHEHSRVTGLNIDHGHCRSLQTEHGEYSADIFILTAGAWTSQLLTGHPADIHIVPMRGQMLCVKLAKQPLPSIILDGGHYLIPRRDGHVLLGSTMEDVGFQTGTSNTAKATLMRWAHTLWPAIKHAQFVRQWSGLRPATKNGRPYLGQIPNYDNVFINAGHFRKGILQAPICAKMIAEQISSKPTRKTR